MAIAPVYANSWNQVAAFKELYVDDKDYMKNIVYAKNPWLAMIPKNESPDGFAGKYIPVPLEYGNPQGRSHTFANAQNQQTACCRCFLLRLCGSGLSARYHHQLVDGTNEVECWCFR